MPDILLYTEKVVMNCISSSRGKVLQKRLFLVKGTVKLEQVEDELISVTTSLPLFASFSFVYCPY